MEKGPTLTLESIVLENFFSVFIYFIANGAK